MHFLKYYIFLLISLVFSQGVFGQPSINWTKCYGGSGGEGGNKIISTSDGGLLIIGTTSSNDGDVSGAHCLYDSTTNTWVPYEDVWVIKLDQGGNLVWQKCLGGYFVDVGTSAFETAGGYILACSSGSTDGDLTSNNGYDDFWVVKINYTGNIIWQHSYGGSDDDVLYGTAKTPDGGFIVCGSENSLDSGYITGHHGTWGSDSWLIKP